MIIQIFLQIYNHFSHTRIDFFSTCSSKVQHTLIELNFNYYEFQRLILIA